MESVSYLGRNCKLGCLEGPGRTWKSEVVGVTGRTHAPHM